MDAGFPPGCGIVWVRLFPADGKKMEGGNQFGLNFVVERIMDGGTVADTPGTPGGKTNAQTQSTNNFDKTATQTVKEVADEEDNATVYAICDDYFYLSVNGKKICYHDPQKRNPTQVTITNVTLKKGDVITVRCLDMGKLCGFELSIVQDHYISRLLARNFSLLGW